MATADQALAWVAKLYDVLSDRRPGIERAEKYFAGEQPLAYASEQWQKAHAERYRGFSDNWCGVVGRSPVDRLGIVGFRVDDGTGDNLTAGERLLMGDWSRNEMAAQSNQGFLMSTIAKRSAVIVWGNDDDEPVVSWEHPAQVVVAYEPGNRRTRRAALKAWVEDDLEYATLYLPDAVWKFQRPSWRAGVKNSQTTTGLYVETAARTGSGWVPREVPDENWPMPNPIGLVPVVEWTNRPDLQGEPVSDIEGTIAMQNAVNLLWAYLFTSADHASMPARVVLGMEPPKIPVLDQQGNVIGSRPAKLEELRDGRMMFLPGATSVDQWDAAKLDVFTEVVREAIGHIAAQTSTPGHYLLSNEKFANLNGDALTAAEVPLVMKTCNQQLHYGPASKETAVLMALVRGEGGLADAIRSTSSEEFTQWRDAAMHSLSQIADAATKDRSVGVSLRTVLERRYGMSETEVVRELERVKAERIDPNLQAMVEQVRTRAAAAGLGG